MNMENFFILNTDLFNKIINEYSLIKIILIFFIILLLWFLPAIVAIFLNPKNFKKIFFACIPSGLSFVLWTGFVAQRFNR